MTKVLPLLLPLWLFGAAIHNGQTFITPFKHSIKATTAYTSCAHLAIFPISYYAKPKDLPILIDGKKVILHIKRKRYPKERLHVAPSKVKPPKSVKKRIAAEFKEAKKIYTHTSKHCYIHQPFILPLRSRITDPFGVARLFNGQLRSYHSGTDFRAKVGTPIKAINDGKVVLVKRRYYAGGSIIIDHGRGIYSCYYHLSRFKVKRGSFVKRGQVIGLSGRSGRVTAPHFHLTIKVKNITVDPLQFIEAFNREFLQFQRSN